MSFVTVWVFEFIFSPFEFLSCQILSLFELLSFITFWVFDFCHSLNFWVLSPFEFLSFVTICVFKLCHNLRFFQFGYNLSFWVLSQFEFLCFATIWVFEFGHNLSFCVWHNLNKKKMGFVFCQWQKVFFLRQQKSGKSFLFLKKVVIVK